VLGIVSEAGLLLEQEHPDPKTDTPLSWTRHRRRERENAAVAGRLMTAPAATVPETTTLTEAARRMHTTPDQPVLDPIPVDIADLLRARAGGIALSGSAQPETAGRPGSCDPQASARVALPTSHMLATLVKEEQPRRGRNWQQPSRQPGSADAAAEMHHAPGKVPRGGA
jgi:hypothetical protein